MLSLMKRVLVSKAPLSRRYPMTCLGGEFHCNIIASGDLLRVAGHVFAERFPLLSAGRSVARQGGSEGAGRQVRRDGGRQEGEQPHADSHAETNACQSGLIFLIIMKSPDKCECWLLVRLVPVSQNLVTYSTVGNIWPQTGHSRQTN